MITNCIPIESSYNPINKSYSNPSRTNVISNTVIRPPVTDHCFYNNHYKKELNMRTSKNIVSLILGIILYSFPILLSFIIVGFVRGTYDTSLWGEMGRFTYIIFTVVCEILMFLVCELKFRKFITDLYFDIVSETED